MAEDLAPTSLTALLDASPSLRVALPGIERAASSSAPILFLGEPGTGRSSLARALHGASLRAAGPLVEIDPGAVPSTLFESELFGHRAGAFTGATRAAEGRVAQAEGGTLVLDHVEELPLDAQPKLLRLLAEQRYVPLGGMERSADVRFIAIADEDLRERVQGGAFRSDLYYRLEVLAFRIPPLRERRDDLQTLCAALLADLARRFGRPLPRLSPRAAEWMTAHSWPGNLRQVRNLLERELIAQGGTLLDPEPPDDAASKPRRLADVERAEIIRALAYTRGQQGRAAELLGISRKSLWEKRKRYGLP